MIRIYNHEQRYKPNFNSVRIIRNVTAEQFDFLSKLNRLGGNKNFLFKGETPWHVNKYNELFEYADKNNLSYEWTFSNAAQFGIVKDIDEYEKAPVYCINGKDKFKFQLLNLKVLIPTLIKGFKTVMRMPAEFPSHLTAAKLFQLSSEINLTRFEKFINKSHPKEQDYSDFFLDLFLGNVK